MSSDKRIEEQNENAINYLSKRFIAFILIYFVFHFVVEIKKKITIKMAEKKSSKK